MADDQAQQAQETYFTFTDRIPGEAWYWLAIGSILASLSLWLADERHWGQFVGQWTPTFLLLGIFHKLVRPGR